MGRRAPRPGRFRTEQPPYSILDRGIESEVLPVAQRYGMDTLVWGPLAQGLLTGRVRKGQQSDLRRASLFRHLSNERRRHALRRRALDIDRSPASILANGTGVDLDEGARGQPPANASAPQDRPVDAGQERWHGRVVVEPPAVHLNGVRVLVTGASSGLGAAMAAALVGAGARVMVTSRDQARAEAAATELGSAAVPCQLDVRDERSVAACVDRARDAWGGLDVLVNNAGIGMRTVNPRFLTEPQPFWEVGPAGFRDVVETKLVGCFLMAREVVPLMLARGRRSDRQHLDERADDGPPWLRAVRALGRRRRGPVPGDGRGPGRQFGHRQHPAPGRRHPDRDGPRRGAPPTSGPGCWTRP